MRLAWNLPGDGWSIILRHAPIAFCGRRPHLRKRCFRTALSIPPSKPGSVTSSACLPRRRHKRPPHIVVTTPESLYVLLGSVSGRAMLATTRTVIVDEIHALASNKRGSHLALSLERLAALTRTPPVRIGLSATQKPIEEVARFLVGAHAGDSQAIDACAIVDTGHVRARDLQLEVPSPPLS